MEIAYIIVGQKKNKTIMYYGLNWDNEWLWVKDALGQACLFSSYDTTSTKLNKLADKYPEIERAWIEKVITVPCESSEILFN